MIDLTYDKKFVMEILTSPQFPLLQISKATRGGRKLEKRQWNAPGRRRIPPLASLAYTQASWCNATGHFSRKKKSFVNIVLSFQK